MRRTPRRMASNEPRKAERRCLLTRAGAGREDLIRLSLGPGGLVAADLAAKLPGRGAWISPDRALVQRAIERGQLAGQLRRALKAETLRLSPTLLEDIDRGLLLRLTDQIGLARRAGLLLWGQARVSDALGAGRVRLLIHARDAGADGVHRLEMKRRAASPATEVRVLPFERDTLSVALGAANVITAALVDAGAAARVRAALDRLLAWTGADASSEGRPEGHGPEDETVLGAGAVAVGVDGRH